MDKNLKTALIIGGVVLAVLVVLPIVFGLIGGWQGYGYGMMGPGMMGFGGGLMGVGFILFWGLIILGIVLLVRNTGTGTADSQAGRTDSALDVLKKRYARGEISKADFEERKKDLV